MTGKRAADKGSALLKLKLWVQSTITSSTNGSGTTYILIFSLQTPARAFFVSVRTEYALVFSFDKLLATVTLIEM